MSKKSPVFVFLLPIAGALLLWEGFSRSGAINIQLFPPPSTVSVAFVKLLGDLSILQDTAYSIVRAVIGFILGAGLGILTGVLSGSFNSMRLMLVPLIQVFRPIPSISLVPLAIVWFGLGEPSKIFLVTWGVFFPVWINTFLGVTRVEPMYVCAAKSLGASDRTIMLKVTLPAAFPLIMGGMRVGVALAFLNLVAAEMAGAYVGLGFRIEYSHMVYRIDEMLVAIVLLGVLGALSDKGFAALVGKLLPWSLARKR